MLPPHPVFYTEPRPLPSEDEDHIAGETFLADAVRSIRADWSALAVECFLPVGSTAAGALLPLADSASMVVIGSTAQGPAEGYLNATALRLAHHSRCRVVVRPETENAPDEVAARQRELAVWRKVSRDWPNDTPTSPCERLSSPLEWAKYCSAGVWTRSFSSGHDQQGSL